MNSSTEAHLNYFHTMHLVRTHSVPDHIIRYTISAMSLYMWNIRYYVRPSVVAQNVGYFPYINLDILTQKVKSQLSFGGAPKFVFVLFIFKFGRLHFSHKELQAYYYAPQLYKLSTNIYTQKLCTIWYIHNKYWSSYTINAKLNE